MDDSARGGDIDLHVETKGEPEQLLNGELKLRARLARRLGERRVEIVVRDIHTILRSIDRVVLDEGIRLRTPLTRAFQILTGYSSWWTKRRLICSPFVNGSFGPNETCDVDPIRLLDLTGDPIGIDRVESFGAKLSRMQDAIVDKLVPATLRAAGEQVVAVIDNLGRMEQPPSLNPLTIG